MDEIKLGQYGGDLCIHEGLFNGQRFLFTDYAVSVGVVLRKQPRQKIIRQCFRGGNQLIGGDDPIAIGVIARQRRATGIPSESRQFIRLNRSIAVQIEVSQQVC